MEHADTFLIAACVPRDSAHSDGSIARAEALRAAHPDVATASIHTAAALGDAAGVERFLLADPGAATAAGGPHGWDPLTYLCFSNYLRCDPARSEGFVRAATALLDAGASPNTGFAEPGHQPEPTFESVLYGACGVAHHAALTALLVARGADVNDEEVTYHSAEGYDNAALEVLVASGRLTADSLATLLLRKIDWHDVAGVRWLLAHGADPARATRWSRDALVHALSRDNALETIELLLEHGADPAATDRGVSAIAMAAHCGRGDVLAVLAHRGVPLGLRGRDAFVAACARGDSATARTMAAADSDAAAAMRAGAGALLARFAGVGNAAGVGVLLDLGVSADLRLGPVRGYFPVPAGSTALHIAAWRARHETVALLLDRGAGANVQDADGHTPLHFAVQACVNSYWADRRRPDSVARLLAAGASVAGIPYPSGYAEVDALLSAHFAR